MSAPSNETSLSAIESRHIDYVPESERHGKVWRQGPFWFLGNFQTFTLAIGLLGPVFGLNLLWTFIATVAGMLFGTLFMAAHAAQGPKLGLPQMIQSRAQFGYSGVLIPLIATTFTFAGFLVVDTVLIKLGINGIFGWNKTLVAVVLSVASGLLAIYGHDWVHRVFIVLFWLSVPCWLLLTIGVVSGKVHGTPMTDPLGYNFTGFIAMFATVASYNITYAPYVSDYTRYLPKETPARAVINSVFWGAAGSPTWLIPLGAWLAIQFGATDALVGLHDAGNQYISNLGTVLSILSVLALVATMGMGAYSGMLSIVTAIDSFKPVSTGSRLRIVVIILLTVVTLGLALVLDNAITALYAALTIMLYLLAPWTAINLIDFYSVRHGKYAITDLFTPKGIYGNWGKNGLIAYAVGIAFELPFIYVIGYYESPGATKLNGVDISWMLGLLVGGLVYWALTRSLDVTSEASAIEASEATLRATGSAR